MCDGTVKQEGWRYEYVMRDKKEALNYAFERLLPKPKSFADLGGVWRVNGAYSFHAFDVHHAEAGFLVDVTITDKLLHEGKSREHLQIIEGDFRNPTIVNRIGKVDAIILFSVLLHQAGPDWDELLRMYAPNTSCFIIYNPQWFGSSATVRLPDPSTGEYSDSTASWQWGITNTDLCAEIESLGFVLRYFKDCGPFCKANFRGCALVFQRISNNVRLCK